MERGQWLGPSQEGNAVMSPLTEWIPIDLHSHHEPVENSTQEWLGWLGLPIAENPGLRDGKGSQMMPSAAVIPNRDRYECGLHQATATIVVIIRVGRVPKNDANQNETSPEKGEFQHRQLKVASTLISLIGFRHPG